MHQNAIHNASKNFTTNTPINAAMSVSVQQNLYYFVGSMFAGLQSLTTDPLYTQSHADFDWGTNNADFNAWIVNPIAGTPASPTINNAFTQFLSSTTDPAAIAFYRDLNKQCVKLTGIAAATVTWGAIEGAVAVAPYGTNGFIFNETPQITIPLEIQIIFNGLNDYFADILAAIAKANTPPTKPFWSHEIIVLQNYIMAFMHNYDFVIGTLNVWDVISSQTLCLLNDPLNLFYLPFINQTFVGFFGRTILYLEVNSTTTVEYGTQLVNLFKYYLNDQCYFTSKHKAKYGFLYDYILNQNHLSNLSINNQGYFYPFTASFVHYIYQVIPNDIVHGGYLAFKADKDHNATQLSTSLGNLYGAYQVIVDKHGNISEGSANWLINDYTNPGQAITRAAYAFVNGGTNNNLPNTPSVEAYMAYFMTDICTYNQNTLPTGPITPWTSTWWAILIFTLVPTIIVIIVIILIGRYFLWWAKISKKMQNLRVKIDIKMQERRQIRLDRKQDESDLY